MYARYYRIMCSGEVDCEPPNNRLHKFVGVLTLKDEEQLPEDTGKQYPLDNDKILLRVSFVKPQFCECSYHSCIL